MYVPAAVIAASGFATAEAVTRSGRSFGDVTPQRLASLAFLLAILLGTAWALHSTWRLTLGRRAAWPAALRLRRHDAAGALQPAAADSGQRLACGGKTLEGAHCGGT